MNEQEIPNVLACDVGNSAIHFAPVAGEEVGPQRVMRTGELAGLGKTLADMWSTLPEPKELVACSVNPTALKALEAAASESLSQDVLVIGRDLPLPIPTDLAHPESTGVDRLCAAIAAYDRLGAACVVADFGTAITIDCVNDEGVFLGGAILPGLALAAKALAGNTAQLPDVDLAEPAGVFGKDTDEAIRLGVVQGARGALREFVERYATELGHWPTVILTGGDAELICSDVNETGIVQAVVEDLTVRGVAMAYYNSLLE